MNRIKPPTLDLPWEQMVAACMRWFGMERRQAEQHVEDFVAQRDRERGRREARTLRQAEGL
jgi:hypothetical protein